jgi:hypothetical protein
LGEEAEGAGELMFAIDGIISYLTLPNWFVMLALEAVTVLIELAIIGGFWYLKHGKLRWYEIFAVVTVANIVTAVMGIIAAYRVMGADDILHYSSVDPSVLIAPMFISVFVIGFIFLIISRMKEQPTEEGTEQEGDQCAGRS